MSLSFQCNQDLRLMPNQHGKKFCDHCQKHVFDLRRKSDEKIAQFFSEHQSPCVIIYQDQLDRLPKTKPQTQSGAMRYLPYAASLVVASILPHVTMAQVEVSQNIQVIGNTPILIPAIENSQTSDVTSAPTNKTEVYKKYVLDGRVSIRDKKTKLKAGKNILVYINKHDSAGHYLGVDTIVVGKLGVNGRFKLKLTKEQFDIINSSQDVIRFSVGTFRRARLEEIIFDKNKAIIRISVSARSRRVMGRYA